MGIVPECLRPTPVFIEPRPPAEGNYLPLLGLAIKSHRLLQRRLLVIVNPASGKGKTLPMYNSHVRPHLEAAGIQPLLFITGYAGHASSLLMDFHYDLHDLHGIAVFGGDGLINEVINGLRHRDKARRGCFDVKKLPLGVIAGGSGNGLARSIAGYAGEKYQYLADPVMQATRAIAGGKVRPVNLAEIELDDKTIFSSLSVGWGLVSDVDIGSEWLRKLGEVRFYIWTVFCLLRYRSYNARLEFFTEARPPLVAEKLSTAIDARFLSIYSSIQSHIGTKFLFAPNATANDGLIHLTYIHPGIGRPRLTRFCTDMHSGGHVRIRGVESVAVKEFTITSRDAGGFGEGNLTIDGERVTGHHVRVSICEDPLLVFAN